MVVRVEDGQVLSDVMFSSDGKGGGWAMVL